MQGQQPKPNGTIALEVILLKLIGGGIQQDQKVETDTSQLYTSWFHNVMSRLHNAMFHEALVALADKAHPHSASQQGHSTLHLLS